MSFFNGYPAPAVALCAVYSTVFASSCVGVGYLCVVRIICLRNITFVEESIGETTLRVVFIVVVVVSGVTVTTILIVTGDVASGTIFILITRKAVPVGRSRDISMVL